jgi:hypothetical protein
MNVELLSRADYLRSQGVDETNVRFAYCPKCDEAAEPVPSVRRRKATDPVTLTCRNGHRWTAG